MGVQFYSWDLIQYRYNTYLPGQPDYLFRHPDSVDLFHILIGTTLVATDLTAIHQGNVRSGRKMVPAFVSCPIKTGRRFILRLQDTIRRKMSDIWHNDPFFPQFSPFVRCAIIIS